MCRPFWTVYIWRMKTAVWRRLYLCTFKKQNELFLPKFEATKSRLQTRMAQLQWNNLLKFRLGSFNANLLITDKRKPLWHWLEASYRINETFKCNRTIKALPDLKFLLNDLKSNPTRIFWLRYLNCWNKILKQNLISHLSLSNLALNWLVSVFSSMCWSVMSVVMTVTAGKSAWGRKLTPCSNLLIKKR